MSERMPVARALVTGADGFVGRRLVRALLAGQAEVIAVVRSRPPGAAQPDAAEARLRWLAADLAAPEYQREIPAWMHGVSHVFHLAARAHRVARADRAAAAEYQRQNVVPTERLACAAFDAGVQRFVFVSTIKVHGETTDARPFGADAPYAPADAYARSKMQAEIALEEAARAGGGDFAIVRPPLVYGPGVGANFLRLMQAVARGLPLPFARVRNRRSLVYVDNLVDALVACAGHVGARRRSFVVADEPPVSTPALIRALARSLGRAPRLFAVPPTLLRAAAAVTGRRAMLSSLIDSLECDASAVHDAIGWSPGVGLDDAIASTVDWYTRSLLTMR